MLNWSERVRAELARQVVPVVRAEGVRRVFLPHDLDVRHALPGVGRCPRYGHLPHAGPEIICFLDEPSPVWVGDRLYGLGHGDIILMPAGAEHAPGARVCRPLPGIPSPGVPTQIPFTFFPFGASVGFAQTVGEVLLSAPGSFHADRHLLAAADALAVELADRRPGSEVIAQGLLLEILGRVLRAPTLPGLEHAAPPELPDADAPVSDLVARAREYIHRHYDQPLTLAEIAGYLRVSPSHLSHVFKEATGSTVIAYLTGVRLAAAHRLLRASLPVSRVAELVGIPDPYYFSRVFRRAFGYPPSKARTLPHDPARQDTPHPPPTDPEP